MMDAIETLKRAIPYVRLYKGKTFVVKAGGAVLERREVLDGLTGDIALLHQLGIRTVFVHGGGAQATALGRRLGVEPVLIAGRRVTDADTLEVVKMVYGGSLHLDILSSFRAHAAPAVGVSGVDADLVTARRRPPREIATEPGAAAVAVDFGYVGDIEEVRPRLLEHLLDGGMIPVVAPLACDRRGEVLNVNADTIAQALACALGAEKLLVLTDRDGLLRDATRPETLVSCADIEEVEALVASGAITAGMLPKVEACVRALRGGVRRTHVLNGTRSGALLLEVFTNAGCGTMIVDRREREAYERGERDSSRPEAAPAGPPRSS